MRRSLALLWFVLVPGSSNRHDSDPGESDVVSPPVTSTPSASPSITHQPVTFQPVTFQPVTLQPTVDVDLRTSCLVDSDGVFGGNSDSYELIEFTYELETSSNEPEAAMAALESEFAGSILPLIFPDACERRSRRLIRSRKLAPIGVSVQPPDLVIEDATCTIALEDASNSCAVVDGQMTIFTDGDFNAEGLEALEYLSTMINDGNFNEAHPDIVKVTYVDFVPQTIIDTSTGTTGNAQGADNGGLGTAGIVGLAVGGAVLVAGAVFLARRASDQED